LTKTFLRVKIRESIGLVRGNMGAAQTIAIYVKTTSLESRRGTKTGDLRKTIERERERERDLDSYMV
jgi:hypothetical protein